MANRKTVIAGLEAAELVITQDAYRDHGDQPYADIVLPAALWAESDAVMVNSERNLTLLQQSIPPAGQARPDWQLICQVATHLGFGEHFAYYLQRADLRRDPAVLRTRKPDTTCAASATSGCGRRPCSGRARRTTTADRHPIRYLNDGVSQEHVRRRATGTHPGWPSRPRRGVRSSMPARTWTRGNCPTTTTRWCSTPVGCNISGTP